MGNPVHPGSGIDGAQIMRAIGELTGAVQAVEKTAAATHQALTTRLEDIRSDIRRLDTSLSERMDRIEDNVDRRLDSVSARVKALEAEDKRLIEKTAGLSAVGGSVAGALAAAAVEVFKRM